MQLGTFTLDAPTGVYSGSIKTLASVVELVEIAPAPSKRGDASPDFRVYGPTGSDFGAGWNKISDAGKKYVSLVLRDPAFNEGQPLYPILVEGDDGAFTMIWEAADGARASRPAVTPSERVAADAPAPGSTKRRTA
jgi:uncharacterized protein (DUF736 family)